MYLPLSREFIRSIIILLILKEVRRQVDIQRIEWERLRAENPKRFPSKSLFSLCQENDLPFCPGQGTKGRAAAFWRHHCHRHIHRFGGSTSIARSQAA